MICLICNLNSMSDETLKMYYIWHHSINENKYFFMELFSRDNNSKICDGFKMECKNCRLKKIHNSLLHYNQVGGSRMNQQLSVNILRRGSIMYYTINFQQRKNFYDFYQKSVVDDFLNSLYKRFVSGANIKFRAMSWL